MRSSHSITSARARAGSRVSPGEMCPRGSNVRKLEGGRKFLSNPALPCTVYRTLLSFSALMSELSRQQSCGACLQKPALSLLAESAGNANLLSCKRAGDCANAPDVREGNRWSIVNCKVFNNLFRHGAVKGCSISFSSKKNLFCFFFPLYFVVCGFNLFYTVRAEVRRITLCAVISCRLCLPY